MVHCALFSAEKQPDVIGIGIIYFNASTIFSQAIVPVEYIFMVQRVEIGMDLDLKIVKSFGITVLYGKSLDATCETEKCTNTRVF